MIYYHGSPMTGGEGCVEALYQNGANLTSFANKYQLKTVAKLKCKIVLDNGAFTIWKRANNAGNLENVDWESYWTKYYLWVWEWFYRIDWFLIPDVIEGSEEANDALIQRVPELLKNKAVPVWHSTESIERLVRLCKKHKRVAIGLCGVHRYTRSKVAQDRLTEAFDAIYVYNNIDVKIHGLRMLDGRVIGKFPLDSGDSTKVASNVNKTLKVVPKLQGKLTRTAVFRRSIEMVKPPTIDEYVNSRLEVLELFNKVG